MNKRIEKLAEIAGLIAKEHDDLDFKKELTAKEKKFAELIIQACIEIVIDCDEDPKLVLHEPYRTIMYRLLDELRIEEE